MKDWFTKNWGLKLGSLIFACVLWVIVTNINDPVIQYKVSNVPVRFIHTDVISSQGKVFDVLDGTDVIDQVTITAARSIIDSLSEQNIMAVADFNDLTMQETISIKLSTNKYNDKLESIKGNIDEVRLKIENKKTLSLALKATTTGEVSEGYLLGDITTDRNLVKISGPESVVSQIAKAGVDVTVSDFTNNISTDADIKLYDADGEEIDRSLVSMNISSVKVNVEILETKRVPLYYQVSGTPAEGYMMTGQVEGNVDSLLIAGKANRIRDIYQIELPEEAVNVTGQTEDMMAIVNVADYLPEGVSLVNPGAGLVTVTVYIEPEQRKMIKIKPEDIRIKNIPDGYEAALVEDTEEYEETFIGLRDDLSLVNIDNIEPTVNIDDLQSGNEGETLKDGTYELVVSYNVDQEKVSTAEETKYVSVIIKKAE